MRRAWPAVALGALCGCAGLAARSPDPVSLDEHMRRGAEHERDGRRSLAGREYGAALRGSPGFLPALMALGNLSFQEGDLIEAEIYYRRVLKLAPRHTGGNNNMAMVFLARGSRLEVAEAHAKAALEEAGPFRPYVLDTLANVYMRQGRYGEAKRALDEAERRCAPGNGLLRRHLAQSRRQLQSYGARPS